MLELTNLARAMIFKSPEVGASLMVEWVRIRPMQGTQVDLWSRGFHVHGAFRPMRPRLLSPSA